MGKRVNARVRSAATGGALLMLSAFSMSPGMTPNVGSPVGVSASAVGSAAAVATAAPTTPGATPTAPAPATSPAPAVATPAPLTVPTEPPPPPPPPAPPRTVVDNAWTPFATVGGLILSHPSSLVERVGFHESNHDGARQLEVLASAANPLTLETRKRGTGSHTAADVVVDPQSEIRAPVTGTVLRGGSYVLYCDKHDHYAVIEPDGRPGWEVKVLHINSLFVQPGERVDAGVSVLAAGATVLPFASQVDEHTAEPSWPHVHIEVVDTSIPDRPSPGGGGSC